MVVRNLPVSDVGVSINEWEWESDNVSSCIYSLCCLHVLRDDMGMEHGIKLSLKWKWNME